jgi:pimeloyl-CoA dehydrogenase small subunit
MIFELSEEQRLFKDSVARFLSDRYSFAQRKGFAELDDGWSRDIWKGFGELGLLGMNLPESYGGLGGTALDAMSAFELFGRFLVLEPVLATLVLGAGVVELGGSAEQKADILPRVADGSLLLAFAHEERQSRNHLADVATTASRSSQGWLLDGEKVMVIHGDCADKLIVSARTAAGRQDTQGLALFLVDGDAVGMTRRPHLTQDGLRAATVTLESVKLADSARLSSADDVFGVIEQVTDRAIAMVCAEAVGIMEEALRLTVDYLKTRTQFGVPIGSFQVLQHRAVDMLIALDQARSMALAASLAARESARDERRKIVSAAKVQIGKSARFVGQQAIQLHGGIGITMECQVGHCFLRNTAIEFLFGDAEHHLVRLARDGGLISAED